MDQNMSTPISDEKFRMHVDNEMDDDNRLIKSRFLGQRRPWKLTSLILPILLGLLLLIGTVLLILTITRRNTCRQQQLEQAETLLGYKPDDHVSQTKIKHHIERIYYLFQMKTWLPCVKTSASSCSCPVTFIHSSSNPSHCIPNHSRCLKSCKHNLHCICHNLADPLRCRMVTRNWIDHEFKSGPVERLRNPVTNHLLQHTWVDNFSRQLERLLVDIRSGERLFLSSDRRTGIAIHEQDDDYLLNERWTKFDINTTRQHIVYTQLNPQTHSVKKNTIIFFGIQNINLRCFFFR
jgi:hypothetical protein